MHVFGDVLLLALCKSVVGSDFIEIYVFLEMRILMLRVVTTLLLAEADRPVFPTENFL